MKHTIQVQDVYFNSNWFKKPRTLGNQVLDLLNKIDGCISREGEINKLKHPEADVHMNIMYICIMYCPLTSLL